jgi:hypothetical protein
MVNRRRDPRLSAQSASASIDALVLSLAKPPLGAATTQSSNDIKATPDVSLASNLASGGGTATGSGSFASAILAHHTFESQPSSTPISAYLFPVSYGDYRDSRPSPRPSFPDQHLDSRYPANDSRYPARSYGEPPLRDSKRSTFGSDPRRDRSDARDSRDARTDPRDSFRDPRDPRASRGGPDSRDVRYRDASQYRQEDPRDRR